ncbi:aldo/keto reductase [Flavobacterium sp.]|uniref:aldo/keto reductase n=1 Tax=Flavobacterium sp. TaxID=239 RepID=UPI002EDB6C8A
MDKIKIGNTDFNVSRINLGGNVFGWTLNEKDSFHILDNFADRGGNFIDTADVYSSWAEGNKGGESEIIIGKWLKERSNADNIVVATKVGWDFGDGRKGLRPEYIRKAAEDSLKRLQVDSIDLYYTHIDDPTIPIEDYLGTYADLIAEGKIRHIAASNVPQERLRKSLELGLSGAYPLYQALQPHYNLIERADYEKQYSSLVDQYNLSVFPYWSLAAGFLTGKYRSEADLGKSVRGGSLQKYLDNKGLSVLSALDEISQKHGTAQASVALAWLLSKPHIDAPIASATSISQLDTLFAAANLKLDNDDISLLDESSL